MKIGQKMICQILLWIVIGTFGMVEAASLDNDITTVEKLQNTIKAMESLLEKQQKRVLSGFDGLRRRVYTLEKIADKTRKEIEHNTAPGVLALCPKLVEPPNGRILGGHKKTSGDQAYIVCDAGYEIVGDEERICLPNSTWSGKAAQCVGTGPSDLKESIPTTQRKSKCVTIDGGMKACSCMRGFQLSIDQRTCTDVDECDVRSAVKSSIFWDRRCQYKCRNTPGSYQCICPTGYKLSQMNMCVDVDECSEGEHNCNSSTDCFNTKGGYECVPIICPSQYVKTSERSCERIPCPRNDLICRTLAHTINYHYMALRSKVGVPFKIFQLSSESGISGGTARFSIAAGHDSSYFTTRRVDRRTAWLVLNQLPVGPKTLRVDFLAREHQHSGRLLALHVARVVIFVSEYEF